MVPARDDADDLIVGMERCLEVAFSRVRDVFFVGEGELAGAVGAEGVEGHFIETPGFYMGLVCLVDLVALVVISWWGWVV